MRVIAYDRTCVRTGGHLSPAWAAGSWLYRGLRRADAARGVASWSEALAWLASLPGAIREIQYWGHGRWGSARVADDVLDRRSLLAGHPHRAQLDAVKARLDRDAQVWFRTCETLGARAGIAFAEELADLLGARVAGHTHIIGFHQSGLHALAPGARADWDPAEGLAEGTPDHPVRARTSRPWRARTITCLHGHIPEPWVTR